MVGSELQEITPKIGGSERKSKAAPESSLGVDVLVDLPCIEPCHRILAPV